MENTTAYVCTQTDFTLKFCAHFVFAGHVHSITSTIVQLAYARCIKLQDKCGVDLPLGED
jgi:hypothetical protein